MSDPRLLIAIEVFDFLRTLSRREQQNLIKRFREIAAFPSNFADFSESDSTGRRLGVHVLEDSQLNSGTIPPIGT